MTIWDELTTFLEWVKDKARQFDEEASEACRSEPTTATPIEGDEYGRSVHAAEIDGHTYVRIEDAEGNKSIKTPDRSIN